MITPPPTPKNEERRPTMSPAIINKNIDNIRTRIGPMFQLIVTMGFEGERI